MKIGFTCGVFDLTHAGHYLMFQECKKICDYLIVGINMESEKPDKVKPIQSIVERQIQVKACKYVDEVIVYRGEQELNEILSALDIDVRIMGEDHTLTISVGRQICQDRHIEIYYNKRYHNYSTTNLRNRIK
jgi:glycerol-3-phosphate cytidylyltransferase